MPKEFNLEKELENITYEVGTLITMGISLNQKLRELVAKVKDLHLQVKNGNGEGET